MATTLERLQWSGLSDNGYAYLDSLGDTGATTIPRSASARGSTGTFGDPRWESLELDETFCIFVSGKVVHALVGEVAASAIHALVDTVVITPLRPRLAPPPQRVVSATTTITLDGVLSALREKAGMPVGDLAAMLGVSRRQFYNWIRRENKPDVAQDQRIRRTADVVDALAARYRDPRTVRSALLTRGSLGTAFDAFCAGDLDAAEQIVSEILATSPSTVTDAARAPGPLDQDRTLLELEHLRDAPRRSG